MRLFSSQAIVALDGDGVAGALVRRALGGPRLAALHTAPLPEGALVVSSHGPNLVRPDEVAASLRAVAAGLGARRGPVTLVLPHGVARTLLLDLPDRAVPREYASFRLAAGLPYPAAEAVVDVLPLGSGRLLASAVRRTVVAEYEAVVREAGLEPGRVDLAPLAAAAGLRSCAQGDTATGVAVVLGDAACAFLAFDGSQLLHFRSRRRDRSPQEPQRLRDDALRTGALAGFGADAALVLSGAGARAAADRLAADGLMTRVASLCPALGPAHETAGHPWLAAALA
jgi:hypothetical protein